MNRDQIDAIGRLRAWIRDYGHEKQPAFIQDLRAVLDLAERGLDSEIVIAGMQGTIDGLRSQLATKAAILKETEANLGIEDGQGSIGIEIKHLRSQLAAVTAELTRLRGEQAAIDAELASEPPPKQISYPLNCEVCGGPIKYFVEVCQIPDGHGVHVLHVGCWKMLDFPITGVAFNSAMEARRLAQGDAK